MAPEERKTFNEGWPKKLFEGGWICATWPKEYGGKGLSTMEGVVLSEEFARLKAPLRADFFGDTLVGPTILQWGTEEQKQAVPPRDPQRHDPVVPGLQRAEQRLRPRLAEDDGRPRRRGVGDQRSEGVDDRRATTPTTASCSPAPIRTRRSTRASATCSCRCASRASRSAASRSRTAPPSSPRCSSPTPAARRTTSSAASTTAGRSPTRRSRSSAGMSATTGHRRFEEEFRLMVEAAGKNGAVADANIRQRLMAVLHQDPDPEVQRPPLAQRDGDRARRTSASPRSARRTRCSGARCTSGRWSSRSTSTARRRC